MLNRIQRRLLVLLCLFIQTALADGLPAYYPARFADFGTIDAINLQQQQIIVGDRFFILDKSLAVHSSDLQKDSQLSLRKGEKIGFSTVPLTNGQRAIIEIWRLPANEKLYEKRLPDYDDD